MGLTKSISLWKSFSSDSFHEQGPILSKIWQWQHLKFWVPLTSPGSKCSYFKFISQFLVNYKFNIIWQFEPLNIFSFSNITFYLFIFMYKSLYCIVQGIKVHSWVMVYM